MCIRDSPYPDTSTKQQSIAGWTTSQLFVVSIPTKRFFFCSSYLLPSLMPFPYLHFSSHAMYRWPDKAHESDSLFYDEIHLVLSILPPTDFLPPVSYTHLSASKSETTLRKYSAVTFKRLLKNPKSRPTFHSVVVSHFKSGLPI